MGKRHHLSLFIPLAILAASCIFNSCKDDVFNIEKVKATYQDKFPVKDIDPQMDWRMTRQVAVNVSVHEDAGINYTIRIYDQNPLLSQSTAKLLAEGTANNTQSFTTTFDCPNVLTEVFVCRTDPHSRNVVKYVSIQNDLISTAFGISSADTRASQNAGGGISIETYSPTKSEAEIKALLPKAIEIDNSTDFVNGGVYKISKDKTFKHSSFTKGGLTADNPAIIIIAGKWEPNTSVDIQQGFEFYIIDGGKIELPDNYTISFVQSSNFNVLRGGTIEGHKLALTNSSYGKYNYNAGTMEVDYFHASSGGAFYNCGEVDIDNMDFTSGCKFINQGKAKIEDTNTNLTIENGCILKVEHLVCTLYMGDNSTAKIEDFGKNSNNYNTKVFMGNNSMITITDDAELSDAKFTGPTKQYALVKINEINDIERFESKGNIYYEVKEIDNDIIKDIWWESKFLEAIKNSEGSISKWGESPFTIPAGDCTGEGNTPNEDGSDITKEPYPFTYVFEDNFPLVGDYDFNDIVLDVNIEYLRGKDNKITTTHLTVTLAAAGASKTVGAGLRIVGKAKEAIDKVEYSGKDKDRFLSSLKNSMFDTGLESDGTIPLFGNEHEVFGVPTGTLINTGNATAEPRTLELFIEQKNSHQFDDPSITKDDLDFFIAYRYRTMQKRMEVHLYEFWKYGATAAGTIQQENLDVAGNNTWAICVPDFRYPKELINISDQKHIDECAYPEFLNWARDRNTSQDWYLRPNEKNVYR